MARDAELDRLKMAQDLAFSRQQTTFDAQRHTWERLKSAREAMNQAYDRKRRAYDNQQAAWQDYQRVRSANSPRIESLKAQQERAYQNMRQAFADASSAHDRRDGAAARSYADQGHRYKDESQRCVAERRQLVDGIRSARARLEPYQSEFQQAKDAFAHAKSAFESARAQHQSAKAEFDDAKAKHVAAKDAFRARLEKVRDERKSQARDAAERAGVPLQYRDNVRISRDASGNTNIYFGGLGAADGPGHGHYVLNARGDVTYRRDPFDDHGAHNFTDAQRDYAEVVAGAVSGGGEFGFRCRFRGYDAYVESNTNQQGRAKIDIYYGPNGPFGAGHHHAVAYRDTPHDFVADLLR